MFKTSQQQFHQEPLSKVNFSDFVPEIEAIRNKKNDSCVNFAHRIDLKILRSMQQANTVVNSAKKASLHPKLDNAVFKRKKNPPNSNIVYTFNQLQEVAISTPE